MHSLLILSAIITILLPPGMNILLFLAAWFLHSRHSWAAGTIFLFSIVSLWVLSAPAGTAMLINPLESRFPRKNPPDLPAADAIVVLGGYLRAQTDPDMPTEFNEHADRLWVGAELYHCGKAPFVILTGGDSHITSEARQAARLMHMLGVPGDALQLDPDSRNTRENGLFSQRILKADHARHILLVTSAYHMQRAKGVFEKLGFAVTPVPCDYTDKGQDENWPIKIMPHPHALEETSLALHEYVGLVAYKMRGWT